MPSYRSGLPGVPRVPGWGVCLGCVPSDRSGVHYANDRLYHPSGIGHYLPASVPDLPDAALTQLRLLAGPARESRVGRGGM